MRSPIQSNKLKNMINAEDIKSIVQSGEGYNAEFKVRVPNKVKELTEEVCAFANAAGGVLLLGVDDDNVIHGVTINNSKRSAIQNSLNDINPHIHCPIYKVDVEGKEVWVIEVASGVQKPYTLSGAIYVRQGPNSQKITLVEQMRDFFQQSDRIYFDEGSCAEFEPTKDIHSEYFDEFRFIAGLSQSISQKQILNNLKLISTDGNFKNGGVLFFGTSPENFFEKAVVRCVAFEGDTKVQIIDDKIYGGPLMRQYNQAMQWLKGKLDVRYEIQGGGPRKEFLEIPQTVFKEAIINALSHRDYYDKGARITVELFDDRVEITNPGGLVSAISSKDFGTLSHSRNPLVFGLFERVDMVEQIGSGIGRIRDEMNQAGLPSPEFKTEGMFTVVVKRPRKDFTTGKTREKAREKTREKIIRLIQEKNDITTAELAYEIGVTVKGIEYHISKLKIDGIIKRIGSDRGGYWEVEG
jgi:ATP-dependent DNA helicase RecG